MPNFWNFFCIRRKILKIISYLCTEISKRHVFFKESMKMEKKENNWKVGEVVILPRTSKQLKSSGMKVYEQFVGSRYICIREATEDQQGILLKVLGRTPEEYIKMVAGMPFCKDDSMELLEGMCYSSYSFPQLEEVKTVLSIIHGNPDLHTHFEAAQMHVNPKALFWVRETASNMLRIKKPQCYDVTTDSLVKAPANALPPYRLTMVYFTKDQSIHIQ